MSLRLSDLFNAGEFGFLEAWFMRKPQSPMGFGFGNATVFVAMPEQDRVLGKRILLVDDDPGARES
ncbi:MAG TPA: hypothetical protein VKY92_00080, partial [Verrucomicrobiae bacterium]|nr:hypothetical protein [Verrucomicrobiae bacterium]